MAMDVEEANASAELQGVRQWKLWTSLHPILQVNPILAHNVIHDKGHRNVLHVIRKGFAKAVVHIDLPERGHRLSPCLEQLIYRTDLSPFWKSTTEEGKKKPWQQAVAPMPVMSRCGRLELACSMALYVLHVLGYETVSSSHRIMIYNIPGYFPFHSSDELYTIQDWP
jgi:hypothetical protein